ncbi:hypothetical protein EK21DRAFT_102397 [Setomelanomma holmii]|uniref:Tetratricopeptide repeat protein n=1 Tax=Setomelanomma holmii TaxID=210430 RepID=A0A9P4H539_9PLEO|nr:hypothetical protein EK21DRAFT_102397 [Setomelanomma holmii]
MATIHIDTRKTREDLARFVDQGIARRLQLEGASDDLKEYIRTTIEEKADGMFLWANLMLDILKWQTTEIAMSDSLGTAPEGIDEMITAMLKVYSFMFKGREAEEFNTILAWLSRAPRPLTLHEIDAALRRLSPDASRVLSLEEKFRTTYASLIEVVRDDGLPTALLHARKTTTPKTTIPETTIITFTHAAIAEYFVKGLDKFSRRKTAIAVGVDRFEAEMLMLKTCFEVFVMPGEGAWSESSRVLQPYAKQSWSHHLQAADTRPIIVFHNFLNMEEATLQWPYGIPWAFYNERLLEALTRFTVIYNHSRSPALPAYIGSWLALCEKHPQQSLLPVAKVVAQIKALAEGDDTLDVLPDKLLLGKLVSVAHWANLEQNASWFRKFGICPCNSGHLDKAIKHFDRALELDNDFLEARGGLANAYRQHGYYTKVVDLELTNAKILRGRIAALPEGDSRKELCVSYEAVARTYERSQDTPMALKYFSMADETQLIQDWALSAYLQLLSEFRHETLWEDVSQLLEYLQRKEDMGGQNGLTVHIHKHSWPETKQLGFFVMVATAARETGRLPWLIDAYHTAIEAAVNESHMSILILKLSLSRIYIDYAEDFTQAEPLLEAIMEIASIKHQMPLHELEKIKKMLANEFCRICIRQLLASGNQSGEDTQARKIADLIGSGVEPSNLAAKIFFGEETLLYLALA